MESLASNSCLLQTPFRSSTSNSNIYSEAAAASADACSRVLTIPRHPGGNRLLLGSVSPNGLSLESECEELKAKNKLLKCQLKESQRKLWKTTTARKLKFCWNNDDSNKSQRVLVDEDEEVPAAAVHSLYIQPGHTSSTGAKSVVQPLQHQQRRLDPQAMYANSSVTLSESDDLRITVEQIQIQINSIIRERDKLSSENGRLLEIIRYGISENVNKNHAVGGMLDSFATDGNNPLMGKLEELTVQLAFQQETIDENYKTIEILTETVKLMSNYISELEGSQLNGLSTSLQEHRIHPGAVLGSVGLNPSYKFHEWMNSVDEKLSLISESVTSLVSERENVDIRDVDVASETVFKSQKKAHTETFKGVRKQLAHDLTFYKQNMTSKDYMVVQSAGLASLLPLLDGDEPKSVRSCFKFEGYFTLWNGNTSYNIKFTLQRTQSQSHENSGVMSLAVCFPKVCNCRRSLECSHLEVYFNRCLIYVQLLRSKSNLENSLVQKIYAVDAGNGSCEMKEHCNVHLNCRPANTVTLDPNFCTLENFIDFDFGWENSLSLDIQIFQLKYAGQSLLDDVKIFKEFMPLPAVPKKLNNAKICDEQCDINCSAVIFRYHNGNGPTETLELETLKSCDCVLADCSPLFRLIKDSIIPQSKSIPSIPKTKTSRKYFSSSNTRILSNPLGGLSIYLEDTSKEAIIEFVNYIHGLHKDSSSVSSWKENVSLNLELFELSQEFLIPDLAQLCTINLISCRPNNKFTFEQSLKLHSMGRKFKNYDFVLRADSWFAGK